MTTNIDTTELRDEFIAELRKVLIGPLLPDEELSERPHKRYLSGMIFPKGATAARVMADENQDGEDSLEEDEDASEMESSMDILFQRLPASAGMTFVLDDEERTLEVTLQAARYGAEDARILGSEDGEATGGRAKRPPQVWRRHSLTGTAPSEKVTLQIREGTALPVSVLQGHGELHLFVRRVRGILMATVSLVNARTTPENEAAAVADILFQVGMRVSARHGIPAYPDPVWISHDQEAEELALQYREAPAYAVGHGCGVFWTSNDGTSVSSVEIDFLPCVEVPPVTTEIEGLSGTVKSALSLVNLQNPEFDPIPAFTELVAEYATWRDGIARAGGLPDRFHPARDRIIVKIDAVIERLEAGIALLSQSTEAMRIFRLANRAMLINMQRGRSAPEVKRSGRFNDIDIDALEPGSTVWRPFQIAFYLMSVCGLWSHTHRDRGICDLIWFPTGGGKTEAYLAVAAFEMLRRRLMDGDRGCGTAVIKRYTLRLLTIQQFERAGGLICALETMRKRGEIATSEPFSLGLWVGQDSSPNDGQAALKDLERIINSSGKVDGVKVPLKHCPACGTNIIPERKIEGPAGVGIRSTSKSIELFCPLASCAFHARLPISFVDEDLYASPPTLLLGTIDKFAMLAWRAEARSFFGTDMNVAPPSMIIQDELHLISGPLGTLAGIYEAAIDQIICALGPPAKYICATATIRRSDDQIEKLYGRKAQLFPPAGISASNSFFSQVVPGVSGRTYIGAMGQGHTPTFSNVIATSSLLAVGGKMREKAGDIVDTWWTVVAYHNSKRELGKTLSLARDDIPARMQALDVKRPIVSSRVSELSANLKDSEIPEALHRLSIGLPDTSTLDLVACTNMLSVGVDIKRLGLMMINGQPKMVSEYIQASSRVGRDDKRPPGLVLALFSPTKPRDRSHYEFFRHFHTGFYRQVEPTSVTPFAMPAQKRGLHGAFLALVRMVSPIATDEDASKIITDEATVMDLAHAFLNRISLTNDGDVSATKRQLFDFITEWKAIAEKKGKNLRFKSGGKAHASLIRPFHSAGAGRETLQSLRNVDAPLTLTLPQLHLASPAQLEGNSQ